MMNPKTRRFFAALTMIIAVAALALPIPAIAQETEDATASGGVQGVTALLLMLGLGAVVAVGLYYITENQAARRDSEHREE